MGDLMAMIETAASQGALSEFLNDGDTWFPQRETECAGFVSTPLQGLPPVSNSTQSSRSTSPALNKILSPKSLPSPLSGCLLVSSSPLTGRATCPPTSPDESQFLQVAPQVATLQQMKYCIEFQRAGKSPSMVKGVGELSTDNLVYFTTLIARLWDDLGRKFLACNQVWTVRYDILPAAKDELEFLGEAKMDKQTINAFFSRLSDLWFQFTGEDGCELSWFPDDQITALQQP